MTDTLFERIEKYRERPHDPGEADTLIADCQQRIQELEQKDQIRVSMMDERLHEIAQLRNSIVRLEAELQAVKMIHERNGWLNTEVSRLEEQLKASDEELKALKNVSAVEHCGCKLKSDLAGPYVHRAGCKFSILQSENGELKEQLAARDEELKALKAAQ